MYRCLQSIGMAKGLNTMSETKLEDRILFVEDVARVLRCSTSTIKRRLRTNMFPVAPLPSIDKRPRWSAAAMERYLDGIDWRMASRGRKQLRS